MAMVEPFISHRVDGRVRNDLSTEAVVRSATVAAGLGLDQRLHLAQAAGDRRHGAGAGRDHPAGAAARRRGRGRPGRPVRAVGEGARPAPRCAGMVVGRSLLYPPDGDVAAAVDAVVGMM